jgi:hypothetical protein
MSEAVLEILSNLGNLVMAFGSTLMIAGGLDMFLVTTGALILIPLAARIVKRKHGGFRKSFRPRGRASHGRASGRLLESRRGPVLKPCPNCAEQLPLSAIMCHFCDYNFLAERPGRGQNLLPPPQPFTH